MSAKQSQPLSESIQFTEHGIPIRNLWYMLLYAWNEIPLNAMRHWVMKDIESSPTLDALLASILIQMMQGRLRIGLGGDYVTKEGTLKGIRGRIDFAESIKRRAFEHGEAHCEYQQFTANAPKNQIVRTTLTRLIQMGQFGPDVKEANKLRHRLRHLTRILDGIDLIELTPDLIHRQQLGRNDNDYRIMLEICWLILQRQMPTESTGQHALPALERDSLILHNIYERFVANFYRIHLDGWIVTPQKRLEWHEKYSNPYLPSMVPDLVLQEKLTGQLIVLDTKFTANSLVENQWGKKIYDSSHLYQLYAYLKSQEHVSEAHRNARGILLYPAIHNKFSEHIELQQDHVMKVESIDLAAPWQDIEKHLLELIKYAGS